MKRKFIGIAVTVVFLVVCFMMPEASAYSFAGYQIDPFTTINLTPHYQFSSQSISDMNDALYQWNASSGRSVKLLTRSATSTHNITEPKKDNTNAIIRKSIGTKYPVGTTYVWYGSLGYVTEVDMIINTSYNFANSAVSGCYDFYSIFLHEAGHAVGLDDLYSVMQSNRVMYGYAQTNSTKRFLTQRDKDGVYSLYNDIQWGWYN